MRTIAYCSLLLLAPLFLACGDDGSVPPETTAYELVSLDGHPVPASYDSVFFNGGSNRYTRIVGATLEILSTDSVRHSHARDIIERLPSGEIVTWWTECVAQKARYRTSGNNLIVSLTVGDGMEGVTRDDTFSVTGTTLTRWMRENPTINHPKGRSWHLQFQEVTAVAPLCEP
jgi:hypothetical protein